LYVHLNPVATAEFGLGKQQKKAEGAGLRTPSKTEVSERLKKLRDYTWSSYRVYGGYCKGPKWLQTKALLSRASRQTTKRQEAYRRDAKRLLSKGIEESKDERLRDAIAIGSERFVRQVKGLAKGAGREVEGKRELRRRVRFEEVVSAIEGMRGQAWAEIVNQRGDWARPLAMWAARRYCGLTLRETGEHFEGLDYAAAGMALKRFESKTAQSRQLKKKMNALTSMLNVET